MQAKASGHWSSAHKYEPSRRSFDVLLSVCAKDGDYLLIHHMKKEEEAKMGIRVVRGGQDPDRRTHREDANRA
jgi:hypothetical protein